ncbi:MAG: VCBS repeat-containing protein [Chloroflexi bacterium]|nr:VCBS repeat-containing protein [Chloroflexota bacterium]
MLLTPWQLVSAQRGGRADPHRPPAGGPDPQVLPVVEPAPHEPDGAPKTFAPNEPPAPMKGPRAPAGVSAALGAGENFPPRLPSAFWGNVLANGQNVPQGIRISAWIEGRPIANISAGMYEGASVYVLDIPAAEPDQAGGEDGQAIRFKIGAIWADQASAWGEGRVEHLDLTMAGFGAEFAPAAAWGAYAAFAEGTQNSHPRLFGDVNGDGRADAVLLHPEEGFLVALSDGNGFQEPQSWGSHKAFLQNDQNQFTRALADVDGDGLADAVLFHPKYAIKVALSTGSGFAPPVNWGRYNAFSKPDQDRFPRFLADVNGDGRADAVLFHPRNGIKVALSTGSGFAPPVKWGRYNVFCKPSLNAYPRTLADVNGDGLADAIVFFAGRGIKVALSDGAKFQQPIWWNQASALTSSSQNVQPCFAADVTGDGLADAVCIRRDLGVMVGVSNGGEFDEPRPWSQDFIGGWADQQSAPRDLADLDGDGRTDIAGFHPTQGTVMGRSRPAG